MSKTVLITGASRGIGAQTARTFAEAGYNVIINYNSSEASALELKNELLAKGFVANAIKADVSDSRQVSDMVETVIAEYQKIDVLINNAGIAQQKLFTDITDDDWDKMLKVNLTGVFNTTRAVCPYMVREKNGVIINTASIWGISGASCEVHYSTVKAGIIGMTKALAKELGPSNIRVNAVAPGVIDTEMNGNLSDSDIAAIREETPLGEIGKAEDVAKLSLFLASDDAKFITGQIISPNGGFVI